MTKNIACSRIVIFFNALKKARALRHVPLFFILKWYTENSMNREEALQLVKEHVKTENSVKHMLASEAIMKALARHFKEDPKSSDGVNEESWGLVGLCHDMDMEFDDCLQDMGKQGVLAAEILEKKGVDKSITEAIKAHNSATGKVAETRIEKAIYCADPLTGLIVATTLVLPSKKLADVTPENVLNRFKEKAFAKGANREIIAKCEDIRLSLKEFVSIGLRAMQGISNELEL